MRRLQDKRQSAKAWARHGECEQFAPPLPGAGLHSKTGPGLLTFARAEQTQQRFTAPVAHFDEPEARTVGARTTSTTKRKRHSLASANEFPPRDAAAMGQAASAELRTAQATISTLTKDLAAARSTLAATEATVQQAKSEAVVRGAQSVGSQLVDGVIARQALERELEEAKRSARVRAGELERAQQELKKARDDMIRKLSLIHI